MKKFAIASALVLCVAVGLSTTATAKKKTIKVNSEITATFHKGSGPYSPYTQDSFSGQVTAKKGKCKKGRTVSVSGVGVTTKTDSSGAWSLAVGTAGPGTYTASVAKKVITKKKTKPNGKKKKKKIVCKAATAAPITVG